MHQISKSHRRSVRRFRNTWLLLAQLCWLFLTDIPGQLTNSTLLCQLCGSLTHLFWMLFWFSTGEISILIQCFFDPQKSMTFRRGGYFSCICNEQCHKYLHPLLTPFCWHTSAHCHGGLHSWIFHQQQRRGVFAHIKKSQIYPQVYLSRYTNDRMFLQFNIATFDDISTICWLRPDYVMQLVNIPVGLILLSNLTVLISAVATAYRSATFR